MIVYVYGMGDLINFFFCFFIIFIERILFEEKVLFEDVVEDFSFIDLIKLRFEEWKNKYEDCYRNVYILFCFFKLFVLFIRL